MKGKQINIRVDDEMIEGLNRMSGATKRPYSEIIREAIIEKIALFDAGEIPITTTVVISEKTNVVAERLREYLEHEAEQEHKPDLEIIPIDGT